MTVSITPHNAPARDSLQSTMRTALGAQRSQGVFTVGVFSEIFDQSIGGSAHARQASAFAHQDHPYAQDLRAAADSSFSATRQDVARSLQERAAASAPTGLSVSDRLRETSPASSASESGESASLSAKLKANGHDAVGMAAPSARPEATPSAETQPSETDRATGRRSDTGEMRDTARSGGKSNQGATDQSRSGASPNAGERAASADQGVPRVESAPTGQARVASSVAQAGASARTASPAGALHASGASFQAAVKSASAQTKQSTPTTPAQNDQSLNRLVNVDDKAFIKGVSRGLFAAVSQRSGSLTMRLHPATLGQLKIELDIQGTSVRATFTSTTEQAQQLLSEHLSALRTALESRGLTVTQLHVQSATPPTTNNTAAQHGDPPEEEQHTPGGDHSRDASQGQSKGRFDDPDGQQGGSPFTWHIPVPGQSAERTGHDAANHMQWSLNVVA
ncbi:MAG: flagellar hook-length control protein FliK [Phycisphaerales bacterium]|nr:flagellar hook-length control protein FliK [Phycisphaerales bacterium]